MRIMSVQITHSQPGSEHPKHGDIKVLSHQHKLVRSQPSFIGRDATMKRRCMCCDAAVPPLSSPLLLKAGLRADHCLGVRLLTRVS